MFVTKFNNNGEYLETTFEISPTHEPQFRLNCGFIIYNTDKQISGRIARISTEERVFNPGGSLFVSGIDRGIYVVAKQPGRGGNVPQL